MRLLLTCMILVAGLLIAAPRVCDAQSYTAEQFMNSKEVVTTIYFPQGSSDLDPQSRQQLQDTLDLLALLVEGGRIIRVEGFSGGDGTVKKNFDRSMDRAMSVVDYLVTLGLSENLYLTGYGDLTAEVASVDNLEAVEIAAYENLVSLAQQMRFERKRVARP